MSSTLHSIRATLFAHLEKLFGTHHTHLAACEFALNTQSNKQSFGDLSTNAAMILAKPLGKSPRQVAEMICQNLTFPGCAKVEIAGPGFINITLTADAQRALAVELLTQKAAFFRPPAGTPRHPYHIEFVSANPTGPLHIGHGRGGIIGDTLVRIARFLGHAATAEFYVNDAGNQIVKLGESFKARCLQIMGQEASIAEDGYHGEYLLDLARKAHEAYGESLATQPDSFFASYAKTQLLHEQKATLKAYGIDFDHWFSEKTLHDSGAIESLLLSMERLGLVYHAEGAWWFAASKFGDEKDRVVKKQTGELTYVAADIAYLKHKLDRGHKKLIMVLGQDHHGYVARLKAIMEALGYNPDQLHVILYQLVTIKEDGEAVRLSKRAGKIVSLDEIIKLVGSDVARFFYLHRKADAHLDFDLSVALKHTDENPVYYLQYALVRTRSILTKAAELGFTPLVPDAVTLEEADWLMIKKMAALSDVLASSLRSLQPHTLTYYALELAAAFHHYYAHQRVIDQAAPYNTRLRLAVVTCVEQTLTCALQLLGVTTPDRM
jgi:arginyl-tRNA synthetase